MNLLNFEIKKLSLKRRLPLKLYAEGYSYEEIGSVLNLPLGTVKSRVFRAREELEDSFNGSELFNY